MSGACLARKVDFGSMIELFARRKERRVPLLKVRCANSALGTETL